MPTTATPAEDAYQSNFYPSLMITKELFNSLFPIKGLNPRKYNLVRDRAKLIDALNRILPKYGINNYLRICAFLGNCGIETDYFKTTIEYASGADYEGRLGLGNTQPGDGKRFKGRGLTQTTGRANYKAVQKAIGRQLGIDVVLNPNWLAEIDIAVESACIFWRDNNLNYYADRGEFKQLSAIVNRGDKNKTPLHWAKRNELYSLCKRRVPKDISFVPSLGPIVSTVIGNSTLATQINEPASPVSQPEPLVLTPTEPTADTTPPVSSDISQPAEAQTEKSEVKKFSEKYLKHCPSDTVKNVLAVLGVRITSTITTVWTMGLSGQLLLIVTGMLIVGFTAYALYYYSPRIIGWVKDIADPFTAGDEA